MEPEKLHLSEVHSDLEDHHQILLLAEVGEKLDLK